jgi:hypothetical protein
MRSFERRRRKENAVVGDYSNRIAMNVRKALQSMRPKSEDLSQVTYGDNCCSVLLLEFAELAPIDDTRNNVAHVKWLTKIGPNNTMKF